MVWGLALGVAETGLAWARVLRWVQVWVEVWVRVLRWVQVWVEVRVRVRMWVLRLLVSSPRWCEPGQLQLPASASSQDTSWWG